MNIEKHEKLKNSGRFLQMICFILLDELMKASFECLETLHDSAKYKRVCFALAALSF